MTILVTGSAGHLGEALIRVLRHAHRDAIGLDIKPSAFTDLVGSIQDPAFVRKAVADVSQIIHTATLHKPHVATHSRQSFVDTNVTGTLTLLEAAVENGIKSFVFTSTTSTFGLALSPAAGTPAAWITEDVVPIPKNIYGATKLAAEHLCEMFARQGSLPIVILRTSRFFPEDDDNPETRFNFTRDNAQLNELLYRRVDLEDVVSAHLLAVEKASQIGFGRYIISAPTPFTKNDLPALRTSPSDVVRTRFPEYDVIYGARNWAMFSEIDRVYVSQLAIRELGWQPKWDFGFCLRRLREGFDFRSQLAHEVGSKGYHDEGTVGQSYP